MSPRLDTPRAPPSPTTIRSSGCDMREHQAWPFHDQSNAHFVSPTDHYFHTGSYIPCDAPFSFKNHSDSYLDEKAGGYEYFPTELPEKPPKTFFRAVPFIPGYEIPIRPQFVRARRHLKNPIPVSWRAGCQRLYASWIENWWLWELLSWVVSAVCMGIIALILLLSDDKSMPASDITLNSIISVLSGVAKAALLLPTAECLGQMKWSWFWRDTKKVEDFETFDMASRGPWGSFVLLWRTKGRTLAAFGAVIVIVSVVVDPFFQQLVVFPQRWVPAPVNGTFPRTLTYEGSFSNATQDGTLIVQADAVMKAFIQPYVFGNELDPEIPLHCPTSNCTWGPYATLSVCSACADITDMLRWDCLYTPLDWLSNVTNLTDTSSIPIAKTCGYFLNATTSPLLTTGFVPTNSPEEPGLETLNGRIFPLFDMSALTTANEITTWWDGSIHFRNLSQPFLDYLVINTPGGAAAVIANNTPSAYECALSWCVKNVRSNYYLGNLTHETSGDPLQLESSTDQAWTMEEDGATYWANYSLTPPGSDDTFTVSNYTTFQTIALFGWLFPMTITTSSLNNNNYFYRFPALSATPWVRELTTDAWATDIVQRADGMARLMTDVLLTSFDGIQMVNGTAWGNEIFVNVRWKWFSLPFALLLLSLIFLLATIFKSADEQDEVGIWKTSALAVLMNGLKDDVRRKMGNSKDMAEVREHAKEVEMKLLFNKKGYRLSSLPGPIWESSPKSNPSRWL